MVYFGAPVDFSVVHVDQELYEDVLTRLIGGNVMAKAGYDRPIISFNLSVSM